MHRPAVHLALQLIAVLAFALLAFHVMLLDALLRKHVSAACRMSDILAEPGNMMMMILAEPVKTYASHAVHSMGLILRPGMAVQPDAARQQLLAESSW